MDLAKGRHRRNGNGYWDDDPTLTANQNDHDHRCGFLRLLRSADQEI